jgi:tryptophan-rich sensory protein
MTQQPQRGETAMSGNWRPLLLFLALTVGGGLGIGLFTLPGEWYMGLVKPSFNPPNWIFGPVWTALYIMIGIAGWRIYKNDPSGAAMKIWWAALALNFAWSPTFFGAQRLGIALLIILALLASILAFIVKSRQADRPASLLFIPYAAWVGFATLLNGALFMLN